MNMKKYLYLIITLLLIGCSDQLALDEVKGEYTGEYTDVTPANEIKALLEKAKWGDGQAYLKLADCYRDGKGVKKDFVGMLSMASLADDYKGISRMEDYLYNLPEDSEFKTLVDYIDKIEHHQIEEAKVLDERIIANGSPDGYAIKGISVLESGDSLEAKRLFELAAGKGSGLAELLLCMPDWRGVKNPNIDKLATLTDKIPWVCNILAGIYSGIDNFDIIDENLAAYYYLKADRQACLTKRGARWLLSFLNDGGKINLSSIDMERIRVLADNDLIEVVDTMAVQ